MILALTILGVIVAIAAYVLSKLRAGRKDDELDPSRMMSQYSDLYRNGEISLEEYNAIKQRLAATLAAQLEARAEQEAAKNERGKGKLGAGAGTAAFDRSAELERLLRAEEANTYKK